MNSSHTLFVFIQQLSGYRWRADLQDQHTSQDKPRLAFNGQGADRDAVEVNVLDMFRMQM